MPTFRLTIAYDGSGFVGWQRQAEGTSIQGLLEDALGALEAGPVAVAGAGRTDAGVHACGQVASVELARTLEPDALMRAVNARLPPTIRVIDAAEAAPGFHARFAAQGKTYRYRILNRAVADPFERAYAWHVASPLDVDGMATAARYLEGRHDFSAFQAAGGDTSDSVRTLFSSTVSVAGPLVSYEATGDGFLRHMVRNIVGSLVEVGRGRRQAEWIREVLASRRRAEAGPTAPPEGLFLVSVAYAPQAGVESTFTAKGHECP